MIKLLTKISGSLGNLVGSTKLGMLAAYAVMIAAIGAASVALYAALPSLPPVPDAPTGVQWLNWFVPIGQLVTVFGLFTGFYVAFLALRQIGKWVKAL